MTEENPVQPVAVKRCPRCGEVKSLDEFHRNRSRPDGHRVDCKVCARASRREYREANAESISEAARRYVEENREAVLDHRRQYRDENAAQIREADQRRRDGMRAAVFGHYGTSCACCGSADRLNIDHVNGDGREHRVDLFGTQAPGSAAFYRWLICNEFPEGFQTLCFPCNRSKADGERCRLDHHALPNAAMAKRAGVSLRTIQRARAATLTSRSAP